MAQPSAKSQGSGRSWEHSRQRLNMLKSSTGDMDSENLWSAAADDFSFFAEEGGEEEDECGIYSHEREKYFPTAIYDDKILLTPDDVEHASTFPHGRDSPRSPSLRSATLSPIHALSRGATVSGGGSGGSTLQSPRQLPMGRNRRHSNEPPGRHPTSGRSSFDGGQRPQFPQTSELPGTPPPPLPPRRSPAPSSHHPYHNNHSASTLHSSPRTSTGPVSPPTSPSPAAARPIAPATATTEEEEQIDLISSLSAFRRDRKLAYETETEKFRRFKANLQPSDTHGLIPPFVTGYWSGEIKVVRNPTPKGRSGVVDMYGNYFEKGYLYP